MRRHETYHTGIPHLIEMAMDADMLYHQDGCGIGMSRGSGSVDLETEFAWVEEMEE